MNDGKNIHSTGRLSLQTQTDMPARFLSSLVKSRHLGDVGSGVELVDF